jgi:hypothetical protein
MRAFNDVGLRSGLAEGASPVKRMPLIIAGSDEEIIMEIMVISAGK